MKNDKTSIVRLLEDCFNQKLAFEHKIKKAKEKSNTLRRKIEEENDRKGSLLSEAQSINEKFLGILNSLDVEERKLILVKKHLIESTYRNSNIKRSNKENLTLLDKITFKESKLKFKTSKFYLIFPHAFQRVKSFFYNLKIDLKIIKEKEEGFLYFLKTPFLQNLKVILTPVFEKSLSYNLKFSLNRISFSSFYLKKSKSLKKDKSYFIFKNRNVQLNEIGLIKLLFVESSSVWKKRTELKKLNILKLKGKEFGEKINNAKAVLQKIILLENRLIIKFWLGWYSNMEKVKGLERKIDLLKK